MAHVRTELLARVLADRIQSTGTVSEQAALDAICARAPGRAQLVIESAILGALVTRRATENGPVLDPMPRAL